MPNGDGLFLLESYKNGVIFTRRAPLIARNIDVFWNHAQKVNNPSTRIVVILSTNTEIFPHFGTYYEGEVCVWGMKPWWWYAPLIFKHCG